MLSKRLVAMVAVAVLTPLALTACGKDDDKAAWVPNPTPSAPAPSEVSQQETTAVPLTLAIGPENGKKNVPVSAEIDVKLTGGTVKTVELRDADGKTVSGAMREDGSAWVPAKTLQTSKKYEATVVAADA